ncbi:GTPase IMAP family member 8-like [Salminus brasiliensis]|uniref:GTPase IMAP family member 8-like n=1 Tax=Salminus brasiliensis TaxID=930266 RepID=UPI003B8377A3
MREYKQFLHADHSPSAFHTVSDDLRMMLLGNAGVGKSAAANAILGGETFRETETTECEIQRGRVDGRNISVIDTPGINSTTLSSEELKTKMWRCLSLSAPGPHVFLLVIRVGRFKEDVRNTVKWILENLGEEALKFTMVLFTERETMTSSQWKTFSEETNVQELRNQFGGRHAVINSKREIYPSQITKLLEKIDEMVKQNNTRGQHYTNKIAEVTQKRKSEEAERREVEKKRTERDSQKHEQERELQEERRERRQEDSRSQQDRRGQGQEGEMQELEWKRKEEGQEGRDKDKKPENINKTVGEEMGCILDEQTLRVTMFKTGQDVQDEGTVEDEVKGKLVREEEACRYSTKAITGNERLRRDLERHKKSRRERERSKWELELSPVEGVPDTVSDVRIVMVGEPGSGKSATGNTILGREAFGKDLINAPRTATICRRQGGLVGSKFVTVIDTKGISSSWIYYSIPPVLAPSEFEQCLQLCFPGPHVFLLVIHDFSEAYQAFNIKYHFGDEFLKYSIVLITHGDKRGQFEKKDFSFGLEQLVDSCGGRYHIFNNEEQEDRTQVTQLLEKIETLVQRNRGTYYTTEMFQEIQIKRIKEESCAVS